MNVGPRMDIRIQDPIVRCETSDLTIGQMRVWECQAVSLCCRKALVSSRQPVTHQLCLNFCPPFGASIEIEVVSNVAHRKNPRVRCLFSASVVWSFAPHFASPRSIVKQAAASAPIVNS